MFGVSVDDDVHTQRRGESVRHHRQARRAPNEQNCTERLARKASRVERVFHRLDGAIDVRTDALLELRALHHYFGSEPGQQHRKHHSGVE